MKKKTERNSPVVYSTEHGRMCPSCCKPKSNCLCGKTREKPQNDGIVRVSRSTGGRKGKGVMVVNGIPLDSDGLKKLAKELKSKFAVGGSVKNGSIEIQGDFREKLAAELTQLGWTVKLSGG